MCFGCLAREHGQHWIGTEHIFLGILQDTDSDAVQTLADLGINLHTIRQQADQIVHDRRDSTVMQVGIVGVSGYGGGGPASWRNPGR